ncbi:hypothetical protein HAX54_050779 [Datura stramonium]|uniref:F-box domain-containing protein n=1 Tax=Datura stramonium TaxID=4076 RepID=A0ABS8SXE3_DATST|nr:hypothetical protein [Datura stramonium]
MASSELRNLTKKQKEKAVDDDDRISQLPDALLVQILSLLPVEDAVTSCVLSKRWRYLWTCIHSFIFRDRNYNKVENFISFVDHVLTHSTCSKIKKFQLYFHHTEWKLESKISQWLSFAVENKVEDVVLDSYPCDDDPSYELPLSMYTCSSLVTLYLSHWVFDERLTIAWNSLKSLTLHSTELEDDDVVMLLSSCPALETMELLFCEGCHRLEFTCSNLKSLTLISPSQPLFGGYDCLEIFAPYLQHLDISGELFDFKCRLVNVSSLVTANLTFNICCITDGWEEDDIEEDSCRDHHQDIRNLVLDYLEKLSHATELIIESWFAEVVFMLQLEGVMLPELRCKCLNLKLQCRDIPCQLEQSYFDEVDNINFPSWIPNTVFPNLKNVNIVGDEARCLKSGQKRAFVRFLNF